jgi:hypothetical protein
MIEDQPYLLGLNTFGSVYQDAGIVHKNCGHRIEELHTNPVQQVKVSEVTIFMHVIVNQIKLLTK